MSTQTLHPPPSAPPSRRERFVPTPGERFRLPRSADPTAVFTRIHPTSVLLRDEMDTDRRLRVHALDPFGYLDSFPLETDFAPV
jgi:hypothetical protein